MTGVDSGTKRFTTLASLNMRVIFGLILLLAGTVTSQGKEWRGIVTLHSTRAEVERLLGAPSMDRGDTVVYEFEKERASIEYSKGPCNFKFNIWNVPAGTVLSIWVLPRHLYLSDLKLNLPQHAKKQDPELPYIYNFVDEKQGVRYQIDESKSQMVTLIEYFPATTDARLKCPSTRLNRANRAPTRKPKKNRRSRVGLWAQP